MNWERGCWLPIIFILAFAVAAFSLNDVIFHGAAPSFIYMPSRDKVEFGKRLLFIQTTTVGGIASRTGKNTGYRGIPLSPNLSSCHRSLTDWNRPVYCCPATRDAEQPIIDFQFPPSSSRLRVRRPAHLAAADYIAKYERAVAKMKRLDPDHPHHFYRQAELHCLFCTGAYDQDASTTILKIHGNWLFFPWHRMYVYFHERILAKLAGDDDFALPFWNWDAPEGMVLPDMYTAGSLFDPQRDDNHLPPTVTDINYFFRESGLSDAAQIDTNLAFMYTQMVSGAKKPELFMGCPLRSGEEGACDGPGTFESSPHDTLHAWIGSGLNPERENMGAFYSAARDPVFYAHHTNVDRLWNVWRSQHGGQVFDEPEWLDSHFYFYDENVNLVRVRVRDVLDHTKLGYAYEDVDNPWLNARPQPSMPPKIARQLLKMREEEQDHDHQFHRHHHGLRLPSDRLHGWALDRVVRTKIQRRARTMEGEEEEVLVVFGIEMKRDMYVKFDVFVNAIDEQALDPRAREFAGSFVSVPHGATPVRERPTAMSKIELKMGISELLEDLEAEEDESIWVTLVPRAGEGANTTVDGVRIDYM